MVKPLPTECAGASEKLPRLRDRDKTLFELQLAMHRLQKRQEKATIAAVAREANVTPALIHNRYPDFAEEVRKVNGKATREQRDAKHTLLVSEREKNRRLREDLSKLLVELQDLASINEGLRQELAVAEAIADGKIARFPQGGKEGNKPVR
jgi:AcrR family transcriptional regulator